MRILITNDDGIDAPGLETLHRIADEIAGPEGEVWTVAPAFEQSGVAHLTSHKHPMHVSEIAPRRVAVEGAPADCVVTALHHVMDARPDLVLSGVNRGNNIAENVHYSGTVGAALEGALQGLPSIALSQFYGPENVDADDPFEAAAAWGVRVVRRILDADHWGDGPYRLFHNVNFPPMPAAPVRGIRTVPMGWRETVNFSVEPAQSPGDRRFVWLKGGPQHHASTPGTDAALCLDGWITVTPILTDLTDHASLDALRAKIDT